MFEKVAGRWSADGVRRGGLLTKCHSIVTPCKHFSHINASTDYRPAYGVNDNDDLDKNGIDMAHGDNHRVIFV